MDRLTSLALALVLIPSMAHAQALPGTKSWDDRGDPAAEMVAGIDRFLDRELAASVERRQAHWHRDFSSKEAYARSVEPNRERFVRAIGATGKRVAPVEMAYVATTEAGTLVATTPTFSVFAVRWPVYPGVDAEGLWLEPSGTVKAKLVVMGDADATPEEVVAGPIARRLASNGCRVLVPTLIDRSDEFSGNPGVRMTNLTHREWIYRMAFEVGRHVIGYEVDKVRAAVDWFARPGAPALPIGVVGHGEGGLIALYAAAADPRIDVAWVGGYFAHREEVWQEPIDRNVWSLLEEFGDAEIASLIVPRSLVIEACKGPEVAGPPPPRDGRNDAAPGRLTTPNPADVEAEFRRALGLVAKLGGEPSLKLIKDGKSGEALVAFLGALGIDRVDPAPPGPLTFARPNFDPRARQNRQVSQLVEYTQGLVRTSELRRMELWAMADSSTPERWAETTEPLRQKFWDEVIGRFPPATEPIEPRTKQLFDEPGWTGHAVTIGVWPGVPASGILLLPKDLKPGERRPVVVCQHGLEGRPEDVVDPRIASVYNHFGAQLADRGYIVYAPQNPYIGKDAFRVLQRKANPLKRSLFAVIVRQHERTLEWLASLPQVDPARIAFYGLSYGGKTAMRVPALLPGYCLSICSGDFNEWVVKNASIDRKYSYMFTYEYEMPEFGLAEGFNYAEMAALIAPRPFQVERGHRDAVAPDEWVGYEYAKVRRLYAALGIPERTEIAYFNDGHKIDGRGTFPFLAKHLNWPRGK